MKTPYIRSCNRNIACPLPIPRPVAKLSNCKGHDQCHESFKQIKEKWQGNIIPSSQFNGRGNHTTSKLSSKPGKREDTFAMDIGVQVDDAENADLEIIDDEPALRGRFVNTVRGPGFPEISLDNIALEFFDAGSSSGNSDRGQSAWWKDDVSPRKESGSSSS